LTNCALMSLDTVLKCSIAFIWVRRVVTAKITFVRAPQTHVIRRCAVDDLRPAGRLAITGAASVPTFPRHLMMEYGVPAGEASTAVARSQAVRGWGTAYSATIMRIFCAHRLSYEVELVFYPDNCCCVPLVDSTTQRTKSTHQVCDCSIVN